MTFRPKMKEALDYEISFGLDSRLSKKWALVIIGIFTLIFSAAAYYIYNLNFGLDERGVFERQIDALEKSASKRGANPETKLNLALSYYLNGDTDKASRQYEELLEENPNNAAANIYYGLILADQQQYSKAQAYLEKGVALAPEREKLAYLYLGICAYQTGSLDKASKYFAISSRVNSSSPLNSYYLGLIAKKRGDYQKAKTEFSKALKQAGGDFPVASQELLSMPKK